MWYKKSAEQGYARAQCCLGFCYAKGYAVEQSYSKAVGWYRKSAEQGDARAQFFYGLCLEYGKGIDKDINEALKWYQKSADNGYESAKLKIQKTEEKLKHF